MFELKASGRVQHISAWSSGMCSSRLGIVVVVVVVPSDTTIVVVVVA